MAFRNEVYLSGRVAGKVRQPTGNGPYRFQLQQGGGARKDKPGEFWKRSYFDVTVWPQRSCAALVNQLTPGQEIEVSGRLDVNEWEKDGIKQRSVSVTAAEITFPEKMPPEPQKRVESLEITDEDVPF